MCITSIFKAYWDKRDNGGYSTDILFLYNKFNAITKNQKFCSQNGILPFANFLGLVMAYSVHYIL